MIFQLSDDIVFPDPRMGEEDGLLAVGGDLSVDRLILAYSYGIFPWFSFRDWPEPAWYCPMQRFVVFPDEIHVSHSMRTLMNKGTYRVTFNRDFDGVIQGCSQVDNRYYMAGAWLDENMMTAYRELNRQGYACSVEVWNKAGDLAGGLYGVVMGDCFIGESMFSRESNTSKLALIHLAKFMQRIGGKLIDCQLETPHLKSMGGRFIPYVEYMEYLNPEGLKELNKGPLTTIVDEEPPSEQIDGEQQ